MNENIHYVNPADRDSRISRAAACRILRTTPPILERLAQAHDVGRFQLPGCNRVWFNRAAVERLAQQAGGRG